MFEKQAGALPSAEKEYQATAVPVILTVAGSDSGGGAGIQADIKTISVLGAFATSAITALTAQNGFEVSGVWACPPEFVRQQILAVERGFSIAAAKTGMLANEGVIDAVADCFLKKDFPLVVDPVCVSESGYALLQDMALHKLREKMLPLADILTPNVPEASALTGLEIRDAKSAEKAVRTLLRMKARAVLLKGGHMPFRYGEEKVTDWLGLPDGSIVAMQQPRIYTPNNHGTGCTLAAAIASYLGFGLPLLAAVKEAQRYLNCALAAAYAPGLGAGPPDHMAWRRRLG